MKRGKKVLFYIFSIFLSCLFASFFTSNVKAATYTYTCIDEDTELECTGATGGFYYRLKEVELENGFTGNITVPAEYNGTYGLGNVEIIDSNAIVVLGDSASIDEIILPNTLLKISDNAFSNNKIASIGTIRLPISLRTIGDTLFDDNTAVDNVYISHYEYSDGSDMHNVSFGTDSLLNVNRIICSNVNLYLHYKEDVSLNNLPFTVVYTYNFYSYQNETETTIFSTKQYYLTDDGIYIDTIAVSPLVTGLNFLNWKLKNGGIYTNLSNNMYIDRDGIVTTFSVYPEFELKNVTFELGSFDRDNHNATSADYDAAADLLTLKVSNIDHELIADVDFANSIALVWKKNGLTIAGASANEYAVDSVSDSGAYLVEVHSTYTYGNYVYNNVVSHDGTITINPAPLYINIQNATTTYGTYIDESDIEYEIRGNLEVGFVQAITFNYPHGASYHNVGSYNNTITIDSISIKVNNEEKIGNYNVACTSGNYIVNPLLINASYVGNREITYGDELNITKEYVNDIYGDDVGVEVEFSLSDEENVGVHTIGGVKNLNNSNYSIVFDPLNTNSTITINPKEVELNYSIDTATYNGRDKNVVAYYLDVNNLQVSVPYTIERYVNGFSEVTTATNFRDAGVYTIRVTTLENTNYVLSNEENGHVDLDVIISKYTPTTENLTYNTYQSYTYTGSRINPSIQVDNSEQSVSYVCNVGLNASDCINVGSYSVTASLEESLNFNSVQVVITLAIQPRYIVLTPKNFNLYYGEEPNFEEQIEINGERVIVAYFTNATSASPVGSYDIIRAVIKNAMNGADHSNYKGSIQYEECINKVDVIKRPVEIVYYNYTNLVYDARVKRVGAYAVDTLSNKVVDDIELEVISDEGEIKDAKTYHLHAHFTSDIYYSVNSNSLEFSISKATYDMSNVKLNDARYIFDFSNHGIEIEGNLPVGVSVVYTVDGKDGNASSRIFGHTIEAKFISEDGNYIDIPSLTATLYIDGSWMFVTLISAIMLAGIVIGVVILYTRYRREHPRKIKLKLKITNKEDMAAKRLASSVNEVLAEEGEAISKEEVSESQEKLVESEDDIIEDNTSTFIERIYAADSDLKYYYSEVKNEILSYDGVTHTVDRKYELFYHGTRQIAKLSICNGILRLYVNLDPDKYDKEQYHQRDMSNFECHAHTPLRIKVNTTESLRNAKIFIRILRKKENLKAISSFVRIDYEKFYTLKENKFPKFFKKMFGQANKKE